MARFTYLVCHLNNLKASVENSDNSRNDLCFLLNTTDGGVRQETRHGYLTKRDTWSVLFAVDLTLILGIFGTALSWTGQAVDRAHITTHVHAATTYAASSPSRLRLQSLVLRDSIGISYQHPLADWDLVAPTGMCTSVQD